QLIGIELFHLKGFTAIHGHRVRRSQRPAAATPGGGDDHIPGLELLEQQRGICMERVARQEMKVEYGEGHRGVLLRIREDPPHAPSDDRRDNTVQARITIEQRPQGSAAVTVQLDHCKRQYLDRAGLLSGSLLRYLTKARINLSSFIAL